MKYKILGFVVSFLNFMDCLITLYVVQNGYAAEANPLMAAVINASPWYFLFVKVLFSLLLILVGFKINKYDFLKPSLWVAFVMYLLVIIWNVFGFAFYVVH